MDCIPGWSWCPVMERPVKDSEGHRPAAATLCNGTPHRAMLLPDGQIPVEAKALNLLSEMRSELANPSAQITGTEGAWPLFVKDWCDRALELLVPGA